MVDIDIGNGGNSLTELDDDQGPTIISPADEGDESFPPVSNLTPETPILDEPEETTYIEKESEPPEALLNPAEVSTPKELDHQSPIQNLESVKVEDIQQASDLKVKKVSIHSKFSVPIRRAPAVAVHEYLYKKAAPVIRNPLLPTYQSRGSKFKAGKTKSGALSVLQYPGHTKDLNLERSELLCYKGVYDQKWSPNPLGCNIVKPVTLKKSVRQARVKTNNDWKLAEEILKEKRDTDLAIELGYETLVGNLLYIDIPHGVDINRSWQNYLCEVTMEWGFPYYKGTTERPRMKQPEPYLAHQMVEKLWKIPKATRRRANSVDELNLM